jgi:hypothetical protein
MSARLEADAFRSEAVEAASIKMPYNRLQKVFFAI